MYIMACLARLSKTGANLRPLPPPGKLALCTCPYALFTTIGNIYIMYSCVMFGVAVGCLRGPPPPMPQPASAPGRGCTIMLRNVVSS